MNRLKLRISPSKLEQFRLYYTEAFRGAITQESVIADIKGEKEWKPEMKFGLAVHGIIEHGPEPFYDPESGNYVYTEDRMPGKIIMTPEEIKPALRYRERYPDMIHESWAKYFMNVNDYNVVINMRIDGMNGLVVHECKTGKRLNGTEYYYQSLQWRCYALATQCAMVQYDIFQYQEPKKGPRVLRYVDPPYQYFPYPGMEEDVRSWASKFVEFVELHGLLDYITSPYQD